MIRLRLADFSYLISLEMPGANTDGLLPPHNTCFRRHRYGTKACAAERIRADDLENAVIDELMKTFMRRNRLEVVIRNAIGRMEASRPRLADEVAAAAVTIRQLEESLERYFRAFEVATMSEVACAPRIQQLTEELRSLRTRHADLMAIRDDAPIATAPDLVGLRSRMKDTLSENEPLRRKALLQELVSHVTVHPRCAKPVFRVPFGVVRPLYGLVGPGLQRSNQFTELNGCDIPLAK